MTEDEAIPVYEERKDEHRRRIAEYGEPALAVFAADKLANVAMLREAYLLLGEAVGDELAVPLDLKVFIWEEDLEMLFGEAPEMALTDRVRRRAGQALGRSLQEREFLSQAEPPPQRQHVPEQGEGDGGADAGDRGDDALAEEDVGDQHDRAGHRQGEEGEAGDRRAVGDADQLVLLLQVKGEAVVRRGRDQQDRRERRAEQGEEVDALLEAVDLGEVLLEGNSEQKAKSTCTPGSATRNSCSSSLRLRSRRSFSLSSLPDGRSSIRSP